MSFCQETLASPNDKVSCQELDCEVKIKQACIFLTCTVF